jgi:hypothetical protein
MRMTEVVRKTGNPLARISWSRKTPEAGCSAAGS